MRRAKAIVDLLLKKDEENAAKVSLLDSNFEGETVSVEIDDLFPNKDLYVSAPPSAAFSPRDLPSIQPLRSVPLPPNTTDLNKLEDYFPETGQLFQDLAEKRTFVDGKITKDQNTDKNTLIVSEVTDAPLSPYSSISGIDRLSSSVQDFSDSNTSWYPDSDDNRILKKRNVRISSSDSSDEDDSNQTHRIFQTRTPSAIISSETSTPAILEASGLKANVHDNPATEVVALNGASTFSAISVMTGPNIPSTSTAAASNITSTATTSTEKQGTRWKKRNPETWKKNIALKNRQNGLPYQAGKKTMPAKRPKTVNCNSLTCRFGCKDKFTEDDRATICTTYWKIAEYKAKKQFLLYLIEAYPIKRQNPNIPAAKQRTASYGYHFFLNEERVRVCKDFFLKTLCISNGPVNEALKGKDQYGIFSGADKRGSRVVPNKTDSEAEAKIVQHINSFPRQESHYCRKKSKRQYLESKLTIAKMYELYKEKLAESNDSPCSFYVYKKIFGTQFNLSFFKPKKDLCTICTRYDTAGRPENLKEDYDEHIARKNSAQEAKEADKQDSITDPTHLVVTTDMQSTLHIPVCGVGLLYYTRKLNVQNYTIYTAKPPNEAFCFTWNETNGKRGSVEIASAINWWIKEVPSTVKKITMYSDTCAGQNRNQFIAAFFVHLIQREDFPLEVLEQKYLESGHTHMEVDSMHSAIERAQRNTPVYSMIDWHSIMLRARSKRHRDSAQPYIVKELSFEEMLDVRALNEKFMKNTSRDTEGNKVMWLKIKCLKFQKNLPGVVLFRYSHEGPYLELDVTSENNNVPRTRKRRRHQNDQELGGCSGKERREQWIAELKEYVIPKAYSTRLPISEAKKKDLLNLCSKGIIPQELHAWYANLPTSRDVEERLCQPDVSETCEEEGEF